MKLYDDKLIVVTGGAGFIGSCVVKELNNRGYSNILIVDNLSASEKWKNLVGKQFMEILHKNALFQWLEGREDEIEAFIHLGACSSTVEQDANYLLENNYRYTLRLAEYALHHNHRFIYASSAATYGDGLKGFSDDHKHLNTFKPLNMYGYSKHLFDLWAEKQGVLSQVVGLKYFNVFGPNEYHKGRMSSAIVRMVPEVQEKKSIHLFKSYDSFYSDGEQQRDFLYVKDAARMTCNFLNNTAGGIFNIGTGEAVTWNRLAKAVFHALGIKENIIYIDMPSDLHGKYQNFTQADMKKTREALGKDVIITPLETAVSEYVNTYLLKSARW